MTSEIEIMVWVYIISIIAATLAAILDLKQHASNGFSITVGDILTKVVSVFTPFYNTIFSIATMSIMIDKSGILDIPVIKGEKKNKSLYKYY